MTIKHFYNFECQFGDERNPCDQYCFKWKFEWDITKFEAKMSWNNNCIPKKFTIFYLIKYAVNLNKDEWQI